MSMGRSIGTSVLTAAILCLVGVSATAQAWEAYPPITAEITSPTDGKCVVPGSPVSLSADVGDQDRYYGLCDEVWKYFYYDDGDNDGAYVTGWKCNGQTINPPWNSWNAPPTTGQNTVTVTANDNAIYANDTPNGTHSHALWTVGVASISPAGPLTVAKGATVQFTATRTNSSTTPSSPGWPSGKPTWTSSDSVTVDPQDAGCASVTFNTTGENRWVKAQCGNTVTVNVTVCELTGLTVSGASAGDPEGTYYAAVAASGDVTITATINPAIDVEDLPPDLVTWTGGTAGANQLERKVSKTSAGSTTVTATCGTSSYDVTIVVYDVEIYQPASFPVEIVLGDYVDFAAHTVPVEVPGGSWLWNVEWGAGYLTPTAEASSVRFTPSAASICRLRVSFTRGSDVILKTSGNIIVSALTDFVIDSARISDPTEEYYPVKADEHYEVTGTFDFRLPIAPRPTPANLRYELWDTDWWNCTLAEGPGASCIYQFQGGEDQGDVRERFYTDWDGDHDFDSGEPKNDSPEFWVNNLYEYHLDVDYSSLLGTLDRLTDVQPRFTAAANLGLKKDNADDYRACVKFTIDTLARVTFISPRLDPAPTQDDWDAHFDAPCDMTLLQGIYYNPETGERYLGVANLGHTDEIIYDWDDAENETLIHEIGHGKNLGHHSEQDDHYIMTQERYSADRYLLSKSEANSLD